MGQIFTTPSIATHLLDRAINAALPYEPTLRAVPGKTLQPNLSCIWPVIMASTVAAAARKSFRELHGVVVTAGLMQRTVKVRVGGQAWNGKLKKVCG